METTTGGIPRIRLKLGESMDRVQSQSTYDFDVSSMEDYHPFDITEPTIFEYNDPEHRFTLPPALMVSFTTSVGYVIDLQISPHLRYLTISESLKRLQELTQLVEQAGWKPVEKKYPRLEDLETIIHTHNVKAVTTGRWRSGECQLSINLKRHIKAGDLPDFVPVQERYDHYGITLSIDNETVYSKYTEMRVLKRQDEKTFR